MKLSVDLNLLGKQLELVDSIIESTSITELQDLVVSNIDLLDGLTTFLSALKHELDNCEPFQAIDVYRGTEE